MRIRLLHSFFIFTLMLAFAVGQPGVSYAGWLSDAVVGAPVSNGMNKILGEIENKIAAEERNGNNCYRAAMMHAVAMARDAERSQLLREASGAWAGIMEAIPGAQAKAAKLLSSFENAEEKAKKYYEDLLRQTIEEEFAKLMQGQPPENYHNDPGWFGGMFVDPWTMDVSWNKSSSNYSFVLEGDTKCKEQKIVVSGSLQKIKLKSWRVSGSGRVTPMVAGVGGGQGKMFLDISAPSITVTANCSCGEEEDDDDKDSDGAGSDDDDAYDGGTGSGGGATADFEVSLEETKNIDGVDPWDSKSLAKMRETPDPEPVASPDLEQPKELVITASPERFTLTGFIGEDACPMSSGVVNVESNIGGFAMKLTNIEGDQWLEGEMIGAGSSDRFPNSIVTFRFNCNVPGPGTYHSYPRLMVTDNKTGRMIEKQIIITLIAKEKDKLEITVSPEDFVATHVIGQSPCPQDIGIAEISSNLGEVDYQVSNINEKWLITNLGGQQLGLQFNCPGVDGIGTYRSYPMLKITDKKTGKTVQKNLFVIVAVESHKELEEWEPPESLRTSYETDLTGGLRHNSRQDGCHHKLGTITQNANLGRVEITIIVEKPDYLEVEFEGNKITVYHNCKGDPGHHRVHPKIVWGAEVPVANREFFSEIGLSIEVDN